MFSFDFHKVYYHIDLDPEVQTYFGFSITYKGQTYYGYHTIAPFGLSTLPYVSTKLMRPWVKKWRDVGLHLFLYLDDGLGACLSWEEAKLFSDLVRGDLSEAGIVTQVAKCNWDPVRILIWLRILIDLLNRMISVLEQKRVKTKRFLNELLLKEQVSPRELLKFAGLLNSLMAIIGPKAYIHTKPLFHEVNKVATDRHRWDTKFRISKDAKQCLIYWRHQLEEISYQSPIDKGERMNIIFSDASVIGGAAFLHAESLQTKEIEADIAELELSGPADWSEAPADMSLVSWTTTEQAQSSTWQEAMTIQKGLEAFKDRLAGTSVLWYSDNAACASIVRKGSMKEVLNPIAAKIQ